MSIEEEREREKKKGSRYGQEAPKTRSHSKQTGCCELKPFCEIEKKLGLRRHRLTLSTLSASGRRIGGQKMAVRNPAILLRFRMAPRRPIASVSDPVGSDLNTKHKNKKSAGSRRENCKILTTASPCPGANLTRRRGRTGQTKGESGGKSPDPTAEMGPYPGQGK